MPTGPGLPQTTAELHRWVREHAALPSEQEAELLRAIEEVQFRQQQLWQESKQAAVRALCEGFTSKAAALRAELSPKTPPSATSPSTSNRSVADLSERARRDAKTKLMNFDWFMERLESYLAVERRARWCGVGVVDITGFKWYNDTLVTASAT